LKLAWANSSRDPISKNSSHTHTHTHTHTKSGGVAQHVGLEFKPQYHKKTKQNKTKKTLGLIDIGQW
jgi:hypothetical protein